MYRLVIEHFLNDKTADLTMTYWRMGLIEERLRNDQKAAHAFYGLAIRAPKGSKISDDQKKYDLSAVYLSLSILYRASNATLSKQYAMKRLEIVPDCPQSKELLSDFNTQAKPTNFDAMIISNTDDRIYLNSGMGDKKISLVGSVRKIAVRKDMLAILLLTAKRSGWQGGKGLFDIDDRILKIPDRPIALDKNDAMHLCTVLKQIVQNTDDVSPEMRMLTDMLRFCTEGCFEIKTL
jgi:hypothetical protein